MTGFASIYRKIYVNIIIFILLLCMMFLSINTFVETAILSKLYIFILCGGICLLSFILIRRRELNLDYLTLILFTFITYIVVRGLISDIPQIKILLFISFLFVFLYFKINSINRQAINNAIVIVSLLQACYGIGQYLEVFSPNSSFNMLGSYDNPAGIAACLSIGYPFCLYLKFKPKYIAPISTIIIMVAVVLSDSRAGVISIAITTGVYLYAIYKNRIKYKRLFRGLLLLLLLVISVLLYIYKKDSATGRLLIWKNSVDMICDKPLVGHGSGAFMSKYMYYQASFFEKYPESKFALLADNVSHPFNEYLLLTAEYGIIGLLLLIITIILFFSSKEISAYFLSLLSLLIFACFSFPLRYGFVLAIFAYSLSNIRSKEVLLWRYNTFYKYLIFIICLIYYKALYNDIRFEYDWGRLTKNFQLKSAEKVISTYQELYSRWNGDPFFLYNYSAILSYYGNNEDCLSVANVCEKKYNDYDVQILLSDINKQVGDIEKAKEKYNLAANMCPNRFVPLYNLMNIYIEQDKKQQALDIAHIIINKKIKKESATINMIIYKAQKLIEENRKKVDDM